MKINVDALIHLWGAAASYLQLREECQKGTEALAEELATRSSEARISEVAVKVLQAMTSDMEAKLIALITGEMAYNGVGGIANQSNLYYSFARLVSAFQAPARPSTWVETVMWMPQKYLCNKIDYAQPEIRDCAVKLGKVVARAWQSAEFPIPKTVTWFEKLPAELLPPLSYFPKEEWLDKACLHRGFQKQLIDALNAGTVNLHQLGIKSSAALHAFFQLYGRQLTILDLSQLKSFTFPNRDRDIDFIIRHAPNIQNLFLEFNDLSEAHQRLAKAYPSLISLTLYGKKVSDETVRLFANPRLTSVFLCHTMISDAAVTHLANLCPNLQKLSLAFSSKVTAASLAIIAKQCPDLEDLDLACVQHITENTLRLLVDHCPKLSQPFDVDHERLGNHPENWFEQAQSDHPKRNALMRQAIANNIHDQPITLLQLGIANREQLHDFLQTYGKEGLKTVDLSNCQFVCDEDIALVAEKVPDLETLRLVNNPSLTDASLNVVSEKCKKLRKLRVINCPKISNGAIQHIAKQNSQLSKIDLGQSEVDDEMVERIAESCPGLVDISILQCPKVSSSAIFNLLRKCSHIENLIVDRRFRSRSFIAQLQEINPFIRLKAGSESVWLYLNDSGEFGEKVSF